MRPRPVAVALLVALAPVTLGGPVCLAQGSTEDPSTAVARARFKEGVEYYDKGQFEQARAAFLQAYALKKHPALLLNLAWSCVKSGHVLEGERDFKQFLSDSKDITDKQRADATDGLNVAHSKLGRIEVVATGGTEVSVDGEAVGVTPLAEPVFVEPGPHAVRLRASDGTGNTESVNVSAGEKVVARLARATPATSPPPPAAGPPPEAPSPAAPSPAPAQAVEPAKRTAPLPESPAPPGEHGSGSMSTVPFYIGGGLILVGAGIAIWAKLAKDKAQQNADATGSTIASAEIAQGLDPQTVHTKGCDASTLAAYPATPPNGGPTRAAVAGACSTWNDDNKAADGDATAGNIAIGVGIAAAVGTIVYGIVYASHSSSSSSGTSIVPVPVIERTGGGLWLVGRF